jgi:hypothetical protein
MPSRTAEQQRWQLDIQILSGLGAFFANKLSAAQSWHMFESSKNQHYLVAAIKDYSSARDEWAAFAAMAKGKYSDDITYGAVRHMRGHWSDRLPDIDGDLEDMKKHLTSEPPGHPGNVLRKATTISNHTPPSHFYPGKDLEIVVDGNGGRLLYRHVNQAERWQNVDMEVRGEGGMRAVIPAAYTNSKFPIQYYFELSRDLYPGFGPDHAGTPYFVVRPA